MPSDDAVVYFARGIFHRDFGRPPASDEEALRYLRHEEQGQEGPFDTELSDPPMTVDDLIDEAIAWGTGRKSHLNERMYLSDDRNVAVAAIDVADVATAQGFLVAAQALDLRQRRHFNDV